MLVRCLIVTAFTIVLFFAIRYSSTRPDDAMVIAMAYYSIGGLVTLGLRILK